MAKENVASAIVMSCNMDNRRNSERQMDGCIFVTIHAKKKESQGCQMLQMQKSNILDFSLHL